MNNKNGKRRPNFKKANAKRPNTRGKSDRVREDDSGDFMKNPHNDPSFYNYNQELVRTACSFNFSYSTGSVFNIDKDVNFVMPGIMSIGITPTFSGNTKPTSPINTAATAFYSWVRHMNSGSTMYDAPDLMLYILGIAQVHAYLSYCRRAIHTMSLRTPLNDYLPETLLTAQGINYKDLVDNFPYFYSQVLELTNAVSALVCPASVPYMQKMTTMFDNVFSDSDSVRDQLYVFVPDAFYVYHEDAAHDYAGSLKSTTFLKGTTSPLSVNRIIEFGWNMVNPLLEAQHHGVMSGDLKKAFSVGELIVPKLPDRSVILAPVYDVTVLAQIQNIANIHTGISTNDVVQSDNKGYLVCSPIIASNGQIFPSTLIFNSPINDPSPDAVMELSNYMVVPVDDDKHFISGSEVVTSVKVYNTVTNWEYIHNITSTEDSGTAMRTISAIMPFKAKPQIYYLNVDTAAGGKQTLKNVTGDYDSVTLVHDHELQQIHRVRFLNMISEPIVNLLNRLQK